MEFIEVITDEQRRQAIDIISANALPVSDINENTRLFVLTENGIIIGTGGIDVFPGTALVRSISVVNTLQGKGYGKMISREIETLLALSGIYEIYLLTTSAAIFFEQQGWQVIQRDEAPASIRQSSQFLSVCPSSAIVMKKTLAH